MASFAKAQLLKYGWTEGKGLGKNENGIVDALKPKLKFDTTGVGHDSKEFKWWEAVYNKAANNVEVDTKANDISVKIKDKDGFEISSSKFDLKKLKKTHNLQYGSFLKTSTLDNGKVVPEETLARSAFNDIVYEAPSFEMSDEQLFKACGGRTAHKGARHGLNLGGKLARIAQQEAEMLSLPQRSLSESNDWQEVKKKVNRKRRRREEDPITILHDTLFTGNSPVIDANANTLLADDLSGEESQSLKIRKKSKKSKLKEKRRVQDLVHQLGSVALVEDTPEPENRKKKPKLKKKEEAAVAHLTTDEDEKSSKNKERKRREHDETNENKNLRLLPAETTIELADGNIITLDDDDDDDVVIEKDVKPSKKRPIDVKEADKLNYRIAKKKTKYHAKLQKRRVNRLSECLMAVNLCEDSVDSGRGEDLIESCETSKKLKKWKKHKKGKKDKKTEEIILDA